MSPYTQQFKSSFKYRSVLVSKCHLTANNDAIYSLLGAERMRNVDLFQLSTVLTNVKMLQPNSYLLVCRPTNKTSQLLRHTSAAKSTNTAVAFNPLKGLNDNNTIFVPL